MTSLKLFFAICSFMMAATFGSANDHSMRRPPIDRMNQEAPIVRIAELEIDPAQLHAYLTALKQEISASIRDEAGVLALYAVTVKGEPNQIRIFEKYANQSAYESHLQSPHFQKYKHETQGMIKALKLIETEPILLGSK